VAASAIALGPGEAPGKSPAQAVARVSAERPRPPEGCFSAFAYTS
jgi:hypothetical protein